MQTRFSLLFYEEKAFSLLILKSQRSFHRSSPINWTHHQQQTFNSPPPKCSNNNRTFFKPPRLKNQLDFIACLKYEEHYIIIFKILGEFRTFFLHFPGATTSRLIRYPTPLPFLLHSFKAKHQSKPLLFSPIPSSQFPQKSEK